ncbi:voltage-dependent T-type calcium channel subunit alpha-1H-like [Tubulanus polymorphus]|uniref:voltage-dependent T-type calcium channel subunit alpha-1H-like n=1 Tax=Tubulanus polymorphus TaxID=672921 RepID=UPI003DA63A2F
MAVILLNCVTLGMYRPCEDEICDNTRCQVLEGFDHFIFAFFAFEMFAKCCAMGVFGKDRYLAETWNRLDMFIVIAGTVEYTIDTENLSLSAIRTIRVLRPLRAINRIPSMRILVMLLLDTLPMLGNVLLLCFFVFFIFGIVGVQLWAGLLRQRCFMDNRQNFSYPGFYLNPYYVPVIEHGSDQHDFICSMHKDSGMRHCSGIKELRNVHGNLCNDTVDAYSNNYVNNTSIRNSTSCINWNQYYTTCQPGDKNPFQGAISFDNIGLAWVAIFQVISLEGWVDIMYYVQDAHTFWDWIYFVLLIVIGSFFMINLCLVVIATQFSETKKRETERMMQERKRFQSSSTLASNSEPGGCYDEILKYLAHLARRLKRRIVRTFKRAQGKRQCKVKPEKAISLRRKRGRWKTPKQSVQLQHAHRMACTFITQRAYMDPGQQAPRASPEVSDIDPVSSPRRPNHLMLPSNNSLNPSSESLHSSAFVSDNTLAPPMDAVIKSQQSSPNHLVPLSSSLNGTGSSRQLNVPDTTSLHGAKNTLAAPNSLLNMDYNDMNKLNPNVDGTKNAGLSAPHITCTLPDYDTQHSEYEWSDSDDDVSSSDWKDESLDIPQHPPGRFHFRLSNCCIDCFSGCFSMFRQKIKVLVDHNYFQRGILMAILVNTMSMGIEYHNQPPYLTDILENSNLFFSALFATEMLMKILADGVFGYISNGFNVFDGFIVILSLVELAQGGEGGLSVLRTFRLLRILKLVRFMPALRRQLVVMLRTMDNVATFFALLVLFMFIFSILGMNLFGCKFCEKDMSFRLTNTRRHRRCDRKNFDTLLWAIITVFQILTQEDWNTVLYNGMEKTSAWAALYFIALMTFGNYVLFNLLVAILVEGFSAEGEEKKKEKEEEKKKLEEEQKKQLDDLKNNQEKERKMLGLSPCDITIKDINVTNDGPLNPPPIITHTAATPMATPQGSPNEALTAPKDINNKLAITQSFHMSSASIDSLDKANRSSLRNSPKNSPGLKRTGSKNNSWRLKNKNKGDKTSLVDESDSADEGDNVSQKSYHSSRRNSNNYSDCNGHAPLNNQRALSPQNSIKSLKTLSPRNSIKRHGDLSRQNSVTSYRSNLSRNNSLTLSRQNSINSRCTLSPQNSIGSGTPKDEYKQNNLNDVPQVKVTEEESEDGQDLDAMDEVNCACSCCPEPKGCFLTRMEWACYILPPEHRFRQLCQHLVTRKWFDYTVLFFIALNCITLAMERPSIPPRSAERVFLTMANYVFTVVFSFEMAVKVSAKGFVLGRHAYLKSGWNIMDGFLVIISLIDIMITWIAGSSSRIFGILRVFRLLRTLRPLRVISRAPGLKLVVQTLLSSLRPIGNIVLICCTFFIIFGILGVQLFKGKFFHCVGPGDMTIIHNKTECESDPENMWVNRKYNFDNLGQALMALFVLASKDGWVSIMYTGIDAVGVNIQPIENYNEWRLLYFISFLLLVGFFVLNMFVGVVVENFHKCRENQEKEEKARRDAKRARKLEKKRKSMNEPNEVLEMREPPYWADFSPSRLVCHKICNSKYFDLAIAGVIGLNVITMALEYYMMPKELEYALKIFNYFFTSVFILEAILKIVALGFRRYMKDSWNQLDIIIVILSIIGIILEEMESDVIPINPTIIRVMRVLRIARVLKLLKMAKGIRALLDTVIQALPQVGNLGLLFFLLFFIFAALGVELFGRLECSHEHPCEGLGMHAHFENFGMAFLTLFRVATGDNWNGIMKDTLREDCDSTDDCVKNCCVSPIISPVYFVVFVLMAQFVLVNVVVAVLMKHLEESHKHMDDDAELEAEVQRELEEEAEAARIQAELLQQQKFPLSDEAARNRRYKFGFGANLQSLSVCSETGVIYYYTPTKIVARQRCMEYVQGSDADNASTASPNDGQHQPVCKQTSLPTNFTFSVEPPSTDPDGAASNGDLEDQKSQDKCSMTPSAMKEYVSLTNEGSDNNSDDEAETVKPPPTPEKVRAPKLLQANAALKSRPHSRDSITDQDLLSPPEPVHDHRRHGSDPSFTFMFNPPPSSDLSNLRHRSQPTIPDDIELQFLPPPTLKPTSAASTPQRSNMNLSIESHGSTPSHSTIPSPLCVSPSLFNDDPLCAFLDQHPSVDKSSIASDGGSVGSAHGYHPSSSARICDNEIKETNDGRRGDSSHDRDSYDEKNSRRYSSSLPYDEHDTDDHIPTCTYPDVHVEHPRCTDTLLTIEDTTGDSSEQWNNQSEVTERDHLIDSDDDGDHVTRIDTLSVSSLTMLPLKEDNFTLSDSGV